MQAGSGVVDVTVSPALVPLPDALRGDVASYGYVASTLVVEDDEAYAGAGEFLLGIRALRQQIAEHFEPHIKRAFEAHRGLTSARAEQEKPLIDAESIIKGKLDTYRRERERLAREEAERQRALLEQQAREQRDREAAALRAEAASTGDAQIAQMAEAVAAEPVYVPTPVVGGPPKVAGISHRESWTADVTDLQALVRHVADHPEHIGLVAPNLPALRQMAKSLKAHLRIPGVRAYDQGGVSASPRRSGGAR